MEQINHYLSSMFQNEFYLTNKSERKMRVVMDTTYTEHEF